MARNKKVRNRRALQALITFRQFLSFRDAPHGGPEPIVPLKSREKWIPDALASPASRNDG
jgi:hypothetical protein